MSIRTITADDLRWLVCPVCHHSLQLGVGDIVCTGCARRYPIVDGIPVLLSESANPETTKLPRP